MIEALILNSLFKAWFDSKYNETKKKEESIKAVYKFHFLPYLRVFMIIFSTVSLIVISIILILN